MANSIRFTWLVLFGAVSCGLLGCAQYKANHYLPPNTESASINWHPKASRDEAIVTLSLTEAVYEAYKQWNRLDTTPSLDNLQWRQSGFESKALIFGDSVGESSPFCGIFQKDSTTYLIFRGSQNAKDWIENATYVQVDFTLAGTPIPGQVHKGFNNVYESMYKKVRAKVKKALNEHKDAKLIIAGHSLGGSLASLAATDLALLDLKGKLSKHPAPVPICVYTFGSPRVGNPRFVQSIRDLNFPVFRIFNTCDLVTNLPPVISPLLGRDYFYEHIGISIPFTKHYGSLVENQTLSHHLDALRSVKLPSEAN